MIGQIVGNYKILQALGEGGVGMVYKGVDTMLDREVAIKVLRPELASQTSVVERFRSEAVTLAKLSHPNIATLFSLFRHGTDLIMVMEFVRGESLEAIIQRRGKLAAEETIPFFCQALDGINHAHEVGIIHRDIKPSNMILTENGTLKVLDFGIARLLGSSRMTRVGNIIGTLEYMSPEQVRGEETDARSDIYALGMMLYELLTGRLPFESDNEFALMKMQTEQMPALPRSLNPDISPEIEAAIMRAVSKNANHRFQNAGEFLQTLLEIDVPLSSVNQFGLASLYQAKLRTRPSKPGIRPTDAISKETPQTAPTNQPTEVLPNVSLMENETKEFVPEKVEIAENSTLLFNQEQAAQTPNEIKQTRLGEAPKQPVPNAVVKETRLGGNQQQSVYQPEIKQTRLGGNEVFHSSYEEKPASFFDKLTWIHYAAAGAVGVVLFSVLGLAAVGTIFFAAKNETPAANQSTVKEENKPLTNSAKKPEETRSDAVVSPPIAPPNPPGYEELPQPINPNEVPKTEESASKNPPKDTKTQKPAESKPAESKPSAPKQTRPANPPPSTSRPSNPPPSNRPVTRATPDLTDN